MSAKSDRELLKTFYGGSPKWQARVDKMSDAQVFVVLRRLQNKKN